MSLKQDVSEVLASVSEDSSLSCDAVSPGKLFFETSRTTIQRQLSRSRGHEN